MRIGYIGNFANWFATEWQVARALEKYATVDRYAYDRMNRDLFTQRNYDIVLTSLPQCLLPDFMAAQKGITAAHYFDIVTGWDNREKQYFPVLNECDHVFAPDALDTSRYPGINVHFLQQGFCPAVRYPVKNRLVRDVGFIGHAYKNRPELLKALKQRYKFEAVGQHDEVRNEEHQRFCAGSRCMLAPVPVQVPGYWSIRVYEHTGSGAFVLHQYVKGLENEFAPDKEIVTWKDKPELFEKIDFYIKHNPEREKIRLAGLKRAQDYTWDKRVKTMLGTIK